MAVPKRADRLVKTTVSGADTWSNPIVARAGLLYVEAGGTYEGLVTIQRSHDNGATWKNVRSDRPPGAGPIHVENAAEHAWYRAGFTATGYRSGSADIEMAQ